MYFRVCVERCNTAMSDHSDAESNQEERETDQQAATDRHDGKAKKKCLVSGNPTDPTFLGSTLNVFETSENCFTIF